MITFYLEFTFQTVNDNIQVKLTHTRNNCLTCLFVCFHSKCRVFFSQFSQTVRQFIHIFLSLRFYSDTNNRFRKVHRLKYYRSCFITQSIPSTNIFKAYTCTNITSTDYFNRVLFVGVHLEQTRNAFFLTRTRVVDIRTCFNFTRINTEESQTTYIWVSCDLKRQSRCFFIITWFTILFSSRIRICTYYVLCIKWRRQESTNIIKQCLNSFVLKRRSAKHRNYSHLNCCITKSSQYFFFSNSRRIIEIFLHQSIIKFCYFFKHLISPLVSFIDKFCRDFLNTVVSPHCFIMPIDSFHFDKVNKTFERFFSTDRNNNRTRISSKNILHLTNYFKEVSTRTVHLINISNTRNVIFISLTPYSF